MVTSSFATRRGIAVSGTSTGTIDVAAGQTFTVNGTLTGGMLGGDQLTKTGQGTLFVSGANTGLQALNIAGGGTFAAASNTPFSTSAILSLNGGTLAFFQPEVSGSSAATGISNNNILVTAGSTTYNGAAAINLQDSATNATQLYLANLNRLPQGTLVIQGVNGRLGQTGINGENLFAANLNGFNTAYQAGVLDNATAIGSATPNILGANIVTSDRPGQRLLRHLRQPGPGHPAGFPDREHRIQQLRRAFRHHEHGRRASVRRQRQQREPRRQSGLRLCHSHG